MHKNALSDSILNYHPVLGEELAHGKQHHELERVLVNSPADLLPEIGEPDVAFELGRVVKVVDRAADHRGKRAFGKPVAVEPELADILHNGLALAVFAGDIV